MADGGTEVEATVTEAVAVTDVDNAALDDVTFTVGELFESYDQLERNSKSTNSRSLSSFGSGIRAPLRRPENDLTNPLRPT